MKIVRLMLIAASASSVVGGWSTVSAQERQRTGKGVTGACGLPLAARVWHRCLRQLGRARQRTVADDVYVNTWSSSYTGLKDAPGGYSSHCVIPTGMESRYEQTVWNRYQDGKAGGGTGIGVHRNASVVRTTGKIVRYRLGGGRLVRGGSPDVILSGLWTNAPLSNRLITALAYVH